MNRELDGLLSEWAEWVAKLHTGALGYPSRASGSVSEPISTRGKGSARVPVINVPARLRGLDRAMRELPDQFVWVVSLRYYGLIPREDMMDLLRERRFRKRYYYQLKKLHEWIEARMP